MTSLITRGILIAALALTGNTAMAANVQVHTTTKRVHVARPRVIAHAAARRPYAYASVPLSFGIGQFIRSMPGGPLPPQYAQIVRNALRQSAAHDSSGAYDDSPSYDSSPAIDNSSAAADALAASEQEDQEIQQMNDTNALTASMAAAEEENDAANAATLQTEINAGM
jgi:hypothetical protein